MLRLEMMANQSVQEEILKVFERHPGVQYTWIPSVQGRGKRDWKLGTTVWPEENFLLVSYLEDEAGSRILDELAQLKSAYPREGISYFVMTGAVCLSRFP
jgi:uncharacterized protein (DUF488 family)